MARSGGQPNATSHTDTVYVDHHGLRKLVDQPVELVLHLEERVAMGEPLRAAGPHVADQLGDITAGSQTLVPGTVQKNRDDALVRPRVAEPLQHQIAHLQVQRIELPLPMQRHMTDAVAAGSLALLEHDGWQAHEVRLLVGSTRISWPRNGVLVQREWEKPTCSLS